MLAWEMTCCSKLALPNACAAQLTSDALTPWSSEWQKEKCLQEGVDWAEGNCMIISPILMHKTGQQTSLWNSCSEIIGPSLSSLYLCEESGKNPEKNPKFIDLYRAKFPRCLGAEWKKNKSMFFYVISMTASLPRSRADCFSELHQCVIGILCMARVTYCLAC